MKKVLILLSTVLALSSCATSFQQIASISSPQMKLGDNGKFSYTEDDIVIDYNFWAQNGQVSFVITNNMDSDVYVDLSRSFLVVNGYTFDYFQNRTWTSNASSTYVVSSAYGASNTFAQASTIAGAVASSYGNSSVALGGSDTYGSSRTSAFSRRSTSSSTVNRGVEIAEKEGLWVPAHSSRYFCEFSLMDVPYRQCGFARNPSKKEDASITFTQQNSPYTFDNIIMLVVNGKDRRLVNSFYVDKLTNIQEDQTYIEEDVRDCKDSKTGETVRIYKFASANKFYINYYYSNQSKSTSDDRVKKSNSIFNPVKNNASTKKGKSTKTFDDGLY